MKKIIYSNLAPEPIGPYSQAIEINRQLFLSGQIALKNGELKNSSIEEETRQVLENLEVILNEADYKKSDIVKVSIFLTDLNNFQKINTIYADFLEKNKPARETVQVSALPLGANIEISLIAVKEKASN
jgi:2-iminobutanoate/2-iminopropanoate deaminase